MERRNFFVVIGLVGRPDVFVKQIKDHAGNDVTSFMLIVEELLEFDRETRPLNVSLRGVHWGTRMVRSISIPSLKFFFTCSLNMFP